MLPRWLALLYLILLPLGLRAQSYEASSFERDEFQPARAFDGDGGTRWSASFKDKTAWIQVTFPEARTFDRLTIVSGIRDLKGAPRDFEILAGDAVEKLKSLKKVTGNDQDRVETRFARTAAKIWRIDVTALINDRWSPTISEILFPGADEKAVEAAIGTGRYSSSVPGLGGHEVDKAFDGDRRSRFEPADAKLPVWVQVQLDDKAEYDGVQIRHQAEGGFGVARKLEVQVLSGRRWKTVARHEGDFRDLQRVRFKPTTGTAWRIEVSELVDARPGWRPVEIDFVLLGEGDFAAEPAANPDQKKINEAIDRGMAWLQKERKPSGNWEVGNTKDYPLGVMALGALALRKSGLDRDDPVILDLVQRTEALPKQKVYSVALEAMFLRAVSKQRYTERLQALADWLADKQAPDGQWGYPDGRPDLSNMQYALLGLKAAVEGGAKVDDKVFEKAWDFAIKRPQKDGGYNYVAERKPKDEPTTGSMTAAGLAVHSICARMLPRDKTRAKAAEAPIAEALAWLDQRWVPEMNPGKGSSHYYWLYGLERVGAFFERREFGGRSWYAEGAQHLLDWQERDGSWSRRSYEDTCFALLFLNRASVTGD